MTIVTFWFSCIAFFLKPFRVLYLRGPSWGKFGFWSGQADEDMCASITGVTARHWQHHPVECANLIERKFHAFVLGFLFIGTLVALTYAFLCCMCRTCWLQPILRVLKQKNTS